MCVRSFLNCAVWCVSLGWSLIACGRDPFWPLGYKANVEPPKSNIVESVFVVVAQTNVATEVEWNAVAKTLAVTGSMISGNKQVVYINQRTYLLGEMIQVALTNRGDVINLAITDEYTFQVAFSEARKPQLLRRQHVRKEPQWLSKDEARKRGYIN